MTTTGIAPGVDEQENFTLDAAPALHLPHRWRLNRAGIINVWFFYDTEFTLSGGRLILRGTNGAGKSLGLSMLLPFLLDGDRRRMDVTGGGRLKLETLMSQGGNDQPNRAGYLWLELARDTGDLDEDGATITEHLTLGAFIRFSRSTGEAKVWYFTTPARVGHDLPLLDSTRAPLSRDKLADIIGRDRITDSASTHRERVAATVFGLVGQAGHDRYTALLQLLHTLRNPDVGNRIIKGDLARILSDVLPPLGDAEIAAAGAQLDALSETRKGQETLERTHEQAQRFLRVYSRYAAQTLLDVADAAKAADQQARTATQTLEKARRDRDTADQASADADAAVTAREQTYSDLDATVRGILDSRAYAAAKELNEREATVTAHAATARTALAAAASDRRHLDEQLAQAGRAAHAVRAAVTDADRATSHAAATAAAAGIPAALPAPVTVTVTPGPSRTLTLRTDLDSDPDQVTRTAPDQVTVTPDDLPAHAEAVQLLRTAAAQRSKLATGRAHDARTLDQQYRAVELAEQAADSAETTADTARDDAVTAGGALDDTQSAYARAWTEWTRDPATTTLLADPDWSAVPVLAAVLDTPAVLSDATDADLAALDTAAGTAADPALDALAATDHALTAADQADAATRAALDAEAAKLRAAVDPDPAAPTWVTTSSGTPLWRAVDFADHLDDTARAGLEAALEASGLLTATLSAAGATAATGQLLVTADGPTADAPLAALLRPVDAPGIDTGLVTAILDRIGTRPGTAPAWTAPDGTWAAGPLHGRHTVDAARHIGATAREQARARRLADIDTELAALDAAAADRAEQRRHVQATRARIRHHVRTAPRSQPLATARRVHADAARRAEHAAAAATAARTKATEARARWTAAGTAHRDACDAHGLPYGEADLHAAARAANDAATAYRDYATTITTTEQRVRDHTTAVARYDRTLIDVEETERKAADAYREYATAATELAARRGLVGAEADEVRARLNTARQQQVTAKAALESARTAARTAAETAATARSRIEPATEKAQAADTALAAATARLHAVTSIPGLLDAAAPDPAPIRDAAGGTARALATAITAGITAPRQATTEGAVQQALQNLDRESAGMFDVTADRVENVLVVDVADSTGRSPIALAVTEFARRAEEGRNALTAREHRVFTDFVLGEVAEELRRRIQQAELLVRDMNHALADVRTSHGISMKVRWTVGDDPAAQRIKQLVATTGALRSPEATEELSALLQARVNERFALDPTAGYATHLAAALDYRAWHTMEAIVIGPEPGRQRTLSARLQVSEGEKRFIGYVVLFAAVDAYLSGLPDKDKALRLLLLDDAFAKVDDRTVGNLMGLLVRLDIDFVMSGHALWGCYPQVPAIDVYEVHRRQAGDSPAITTHVHWDGRARHLGVAR